MAPCPLGRRGVSANGPTLPEPAPRPTIPFKEVATHQRSKAIARMESAAYIESLGEGGARRPYQSTAAGSRALSAELAALAKGDRDREAPPRDMKPEQLLTVYPRNSGGDARCSTYYSVGPRDALPRWPLFRFFSRGQRFLSKRPSSPAPPELRCLARPRTSIR